MEANTEMRLLTSEEIEAVDGGVLPLIAIAAGFGKGFIFGVGAAGAVHVGIKAYRLITD